MVFRRESEKVREKRGAKTIKSSSENARVLRDLTMAVDKYIDVALFGRGVLDEG